MSTYSPLKIELIDTGTQAGTWGVTTNTNLGTALEEAITGSADVSFSSADVTLTLTNTNASQTGRNLRLNLTGTSGGARNLILGSGMQIEKLYLINNGLADAVTVKNTTGTGIAVPAGKSMFVFNNGTNVVDAVTHLTSLTLGSALPVASGGTGITSFGTGVATALGQNVTGSGGIALATSPSFTTPNLGTPSAATLTNATGLPTGGLVDNAVTDAKLRDSAALSVIGRSANTTGDPADIAAGTDHQVLRRSGSALGFGAVALNQAAAVTGTLPLGNGGTGQTTAQTAINALAGATTSGQYLRGNGTNVLMSAIQAGDVPTLNQNTTGSAATLTTGRTIQTDLASTSAATFNGSANITPGVTGTLPVANGGTGATTNTAARTNLGATTVGSNFFTLTNPSAIRFPRINADNTVSSLTDSEFRTAIGAGVGGGTVTSVSGTGTVQGLTLSGTVTSSGSLTLGGSLSAVNLASQVTGTLPVANGGTGQTSYTNGELLIGNTTGNTLTKATLTAGTGVSITNGAGSISIAATNNGTVTSVATGTGLTGGPITSTGTVSVATNGITDTLFRQSAAYAVVGRSASTTGNVADITAGSDHQVLRRSGTALGFGAVALNQANAITGTLPVGNGGTGITSFGTGVATALGANVSGSGGIALTTSPTFTTPALGTPASGNLQSCTADGTNAVGFRVIPQNSQSAAYTLVLADSGKHILHPSADTTARTFTIPANSSVQFPIGTAITFINQNGAGVVTIAITTDTMRLSPAGTTGSRTLAANGSATCVKITSTEWLISGSGLT
jgi:hypothetical protein